MSRFNPEQKQVIDGMLLGVPGVTTKLAFGHPSYRIAGKMFACLMETGVALKLPPALCEELLAEPTTIPFAPGGGTPMRNWIQINLPNPTDYAHIQDFLSQSIEFVLDEAKR